MKLLKNSLLLVLLLMIYSGCSSGEPTNDDFYRQKAIDNMKSASIWLIQSGVPTYTKEGNKLFQEKLMYTWGVQSWVGPWIDEDRYLVQFRIKMRGINYEIHNLYREKVGDEYYEFWFVRVTPSGKWSGETNRSIFYVAKAKDMYSSREILKKSDQFIEKYQVNSAKEIYFPTDDLNALYILQSWEYPDNYQNTNIDDKEITIDDSGNYVIK